MKGRKYWLWRAVDANGYVLDALLQTRRNKRAALRLMRKLLKRPGHRPTGHNHRQATLLRCSQGGTDAGHRSHKGINNRAENSHFPVRRREQRMMRLKSARQCQGFASVHGQIANLFLLHRKHLSAADHRKLRTYAIA
ncbi:DDE-type integrase/transposase/recombinase [Brucella sp. 191011898]